MIPHLTRFLCCCLLFLTGCQPSTTEPTKFSQNVMTIEFNLSIGDRLTNQQKQQVQEILLSTFQEIDAIYNKWNPNSEISQLNALPAYTPYPLSPQLYQFFQRLDPLVRLSEGRFDPTIEPLQQLWKEQLEQGKEPSEQDIASLKPCIGWQTIHFTHGVFYKEDARTQLDFGGVAKGLCVDLLIERLQQAGLQHLFVEWGGDIRTLGHHPAQRPWRVYVSRLGIPDPSLALAQLNLTNQALATSGDYFQYWIIPTDQGKEKIYCHIFNPHTLAPAEVKAGSVASASLMAPDCLTADALAKVLMLFETVEAAQAWLKTLQGQIPNLSCCIATRSVHPSLTPPNHALTPPSIPHNP